MMLRSEFFYLLAATAFVASGPAFAQSNNGRLGIDIPTTDFKEALDITGEDFTDDGGAIVDAFADSKGIDRLEALKQLKAKRKADKTELKMRRKFGEDFVGLEFDHAGGKLKIRIQKANLKKMDKAEAQSILKSDAIEYESEMISVPVSRSALVQLERRIYSTLRAIDPSADFKFLNSNASAVIYSDATIEPSIFSFVPRGVELRGASQIVLASEYMIGGSA